MYHAHFRGTHYEAGFRWGSLLLKHQNIILENIPFEITQERIDYALSCLPVYKQYYCEITEEIQGLADGQHCDVHIYRQSCLVCTPFRQRVTVPVLDSLQGRKSCWDGTVIF